MCTQLNSAKRGIATEEMKQVAKDEEVDINFILRHIAIVLLSNQDCHRQKDP